MRRSIAALLLVAAALFCGTGCPQRPSGSEMSEVMEPPAQTVPEPEQTTEPAAQPDTAVTESDEEAAGSEVAEEGGQEVATSDDGEPAAPEEQEPLEGEILPQSDDRKLETTDLSSLDNWHLTLARNEIFARHGRPFQNEHIRAYFMEKSWYSPNPDYKDAWLSFIERTNADFILDYQKLTYDIPADHP